MSTKALKWCCATNNSLPKVLTPTRKLLLSLDEVCSNDYSYVIRNLYGIAMYKGVKGLDGLPNENFHRLMKIAKAETNVQSGLQKYIMFS